MKAQQVLPALMASDELGVEGQGEALGAHSVSLYVGSLGSALRNLVRDKAVSSAVLCKVPVGGGHAAPGHTRPGAGWDRGADSLRPVPVGSARVVGPSCLPAHRFCTLCSPVKNSDDDKNSPFWSTYEEPGLFQTFFIHELIDPRKKSMRQALMYP